MDRRLEIRTMLLAMIVTCVPALAAVLMVTVSSEPDLSELNAVRQPEGAPVVLTWPELSRKYPHALNAARGVSHGGKVTAIGYMMEDDARVKPGEPVSRFLLLPEAGNLLHAAHRFGDQMIEAHLADGSGTAFVRRRLLRLTGTLRSRRGGPASERPLYVMEQAQAEAIDRADVRRYLR